MKIIMISGKAGSGKNEVAKILCNSLNKAVITSFSKYIKLFALEMTDWDGNDDDKPRTFLQEMGDIMREVDPNILVRRMHEDLNIYNEFFKYVIISDVRLLSEVEYFKARYSDDVITIRVNSDKSVRELSSTEVIHKTETQLDSYDNFDYVIDNDFSDLNNKVKDIVEGLK